MTMHYYLRDHEGNVHVVTDGDGKVEQVNHYYAFGGLMGMSTGSSVQPYKYNGKELDRFLNWDMLDYGARWMDGKLQQWTTVDPLAEKDPGISPYVYCRDNPVRYVDEHGDSISISGIVDYGEALNVNISQNLIKDWETISGLMFTISDNGNIEYAKNSFGIPIVATSEVEGRITEKESQAARNLLIKTIDAKETITFRGGKSTANVSGTNMIRIHFKKFVYFVFGGFGKICFSLTKIILLKR